MMVFLSPQSAVAAVARCPPAPRESACFLILSGVARGMSIAANTSTPPSDVDLSALAAAYLPVWRFELRPLEPAPEPNPAIQT
jgi:hypothetical protein